MSSANTETARKLIGNLLAQRGDTADFSDDESLFGGGRLDSMAATHLIIAIEEEVGGDVGGVDFDISLIDTVSGVADLLEELTA